MTTESTVDLLLPRRKEVLSTSLQYGGMFGFDPITIAICKDSYDRLIRREWTGTEGEEYFESNDMETLVQLNVLYNFFTLINTPNYGMFSTFHKECGVYRELIQATFDDLDDFILSTTGASFVAEGLEIIEGVEELREVWKNLSPLTTSKYEEQKAYCKGWVETLLEIEEDFGEFLQTLPIIDNVDIPDTVTVEGVNFSYLLDSISSSPKGMKDFFNKVVNATEWGEVRIVNNSEPVSEKHYGRTLELKRKYYNTLEMFLRGVNVMQRYYSDMEYYMRTRDEHGEGGFLDATSSYLSNIRNFMDYSLNILANIESMTHGLINIDLLQFFRVTVYENRDMTDTVKHSHFDKAYQLYKSNLGLVKDGEQYLRNVKSKKLATVVEKLTTMLETLDIHIHSIECYVNTEDRVDELDKIYF